MTNAAPLLARHSGRRRLPLRRELGVAGLLVVMFAAAAIVNPAFLSVGNLREMLLQCVPALIVGCGLLFVVITGEIDISVGSLFGLLAALMGVLASPQRLGLPIGVVIAALLAAGAAVGMVNGLLVTLGRVPSIIVTLGMLSTLRGGTEMLMGGEWITDLPPALRLLGTGQWLSVPVGVCCAAICIALGLWFAHRTPLGRRLYAVGSNPDAARMAGLPIAGSKLFAFVLTGVLTAVAALVTVPQLGVIESGLGVGFELLVVTAVVVGGASIRGGSGTIVGMVLAVLLLGTVRTVLLYMKLGDAAVYWERAIQGAFIIAAVLLDRRSRGDNNA